MKTFLIFVFLFAATTTGCNSGDDDFDGDTDSDGDSDVDSDGYSDGDTDSDSDADTDSDTNEGDDGSDTSTEESDLLPPLSEEAQDVLSSVSRLLAVVVPTWSDSDATLALFVRDGGSWELALGPWPAEVGLYGFSWGRGLTQPPADASNVKTEGDKTAPAGVFRLGTVMGYDAAPPAGMTLPYRQSTEQTICVDDPDSSYYNKIIEATPDVEQDWSSYENMRRSDDLYSLLALIDHNGLLDGETPVPGGGSCIFLHLWSGPGSPTIGCTALGGDELLEILLALVSFDDVVLVHLPQAEYDDAVQFWGLPQMPENP
jgi:D-alanyl-D-alanine dipeptidase